MSKLHRSLNEIIEAFGIEVERGIIEREKVFQKLFFWRKGSGVMDK